MLNQLRFLWNNLIVRDEYLPIDVMIEYIEAKNHDVQKEWLPNFLLKDLRIKPMRILTEYIRIFTYGVVGEDLPESYKYCLY